MPRDQPLDAFDPRFAELSTDERESLSRPRSLVDSRGPGPSREDPKVRILRLAIPALAVAITAAIAAVFFAGLSPRGSAVVLGSEGDVRAAVAEQPRRVCLNDEFPPCAWLTVVDGRLRAFNTNGTMLEERGRTGVSWCPSSGWFGSNTSGSRWDQQGRLVRGPATRSLDTFALSTDDAGVLRIDFSALTTGPTASMVTETTPAEGPDCDPIPFPRGADLDLEAS